MKTILLIDENEIMRKNNEEILELSDYSVLTAETGTDGLEMAKAKVPDLIICDVRTLNEDGDHLWKDLNNLKEKKHIPVLFINNPNEAARLPAGPGSAAIEYLNKPYQGDELLQTVARCLEHS